MGKRTRLGGEEWISEATGSVSTLWNAYLQFAEASRDQKDIALADIDIPCELILQINHAGHALSDIRRSYTKKGRKDPLGTALDVPKNDAETVAALIEDIRDHVRLDPKCTVQNPTSEQVAYAFWEQIYKTKPIEIPSLEKIDRIKTEAAAQVETDELHGGFQNTRHHPRVRSDDDGRGGGSRY